MCCLDHSLLTYGLLYLYAYFIVNLCPLLSQPYHIETKLQYLSATLAMHLESMCRCGFTPNFILFDQPLCLTAHTDWLILSGRVVSTDKSSCSDIMKGLQSWVEDKSTVVVEGAHFTTLSYCSVFLKEGEVIFCDDNGTTLTEPVQDGDGTTVDPSTPATELVHVQNRDSSSSAAIGATTAIALILVIAVVVFIIILAVMWKKIHSKKVRYALLDM